MKLLLKILALAMILSMSMNVSFALSEDDDDDYYGYAWVEILVQPNPVVACEGTDNHQMGVLANIHVEYDEEAATEEEPMYQWQKDGIDIPGETEAVIYFDNADFDQSGKYRCRVWSYSAPAVYTEEVVFYVLTEPEITRNPMSKVGVEGGSLLFEVQAHVRNIGVPLASLNYQWYKTDMNNPLKDSKIISGSDQSIITFTNINSTHFADDYFCVVTGQCGTVRSDFFGILLPPDVEIVTNPMSQEICEGSTTSFNVVAEILGAGEKLEYVWMKDGVEIIDNARIMNSKTPTLLIDKAEMADAGEYTVKVTVQPGGKSVTSTPVTLLVKDLPVITTQPMDQTVESGRELVLEVAATGYAPLDYQWFFEGTELPGETSATFSNPSATFTDEGAYYCVVSNECGDVTSETANIVVSFTNITSVDDESGDNSLVKNTPNPFSGSTEIEFFANGTGMAEVILRDTFGKEIAVIYNGTVSNGVQRFEFDAAKYGLSSGIYYYTLKLNNNITTKKMLYIQ